MLDMTKTEIRNIVLSSVIASSITSVILMLLLHPLNTLKDATTIKADLLTEIKNAKRVLNTIKDLQTTGFNKITCESLLVEDEHGTHIVINPKGIHLSSPRGNAHISGERISLLNPLSLLYSIRYDQPIPDTYLDITSDKHGGRILLHSKSGQGRVRLSIDKHGDGVIHTWDKDGYRQ